MRIILVYIGVFSIAIISIYFVLFNIRSYDELNGFQKSIVQSILDSFEEELQKTPPEQKAIIDYEHLLEKLSFFNRMLAIEILETNPADIGFKGPFYSLEKPGKLIRIESVSLKSNGETGIQYLPEHVYKDYLRMMAQMKKEIGRQLFVDSGYRSPGRQAYLFIYYLVKSSNFSLHENAKWIALPGYSEHGHPENTAIDFCSIDGINGFSGEQTAADFTKLKEYTWLLNNANKYNFHISYPEKNPFGVAFEPWHWHWDNKKAK